MNSAIVVAAGKSERMGANVDKAFLQLGIKPVLVYSLEAFEKCPEVDEVILVVRKDRLNGARAMAQMYGCAKVRAVIPGGARRQDSVAAGLAELNDETRVVAVHDGARPCVTPAIISDTVAAAARYGSGVAATKVTDTVKYVERGAKITRTLDRSKLWTVQTPQAFKTALLRRAFAAVEKKGVTVTDEASAVEFIGEDVRLVPVSGPNIKITTPDDLPVAAAMLKLDPSLGT